MAICLTVMRQHKRQPRKLTDTKKENKLSRDISLFADYHQKENSLTNYCGLVMKLLYEESPKRFQEFLTTLIDGQIDLVIGPTFKQQTKEISSIPDLSIIQKSVSIFFETKRTNWFYNDQLIRHIQGFDENAKLKILFLLSDFDEDDISVQIRESVDKARTQNIIIQPISFERFIDTLEKVCNTEYLLNLVEEFKTYLDRNSYLPKWKYLLDIVSCSGTIEEVKKGVYMCPNTGGAYNHRRAKYFAPYLQKAVKTIHEIRAIVVVEKDFGQATIKWNNSNEKEDNLKNEAIEKVKMWQWRIDENKTTDIQVFLLKDGVETNFKKETSGGMLQSKKYFWDIALDCKNSTELAAKLNDRNWGEFEYLNK